MTLTNNYGMPTACQGLHSVMGTVGWIGDCGVNKTWSFQECRIGFKRSTLLTRSHCAIIRLRLLKKSVGCSKYVIEGPDWYSGGPGWTASLRMWCLSPGLKNEWDNLDKAKVRAESERRDDSWQSRSPAEAYMTDVFSVFYGMLGRFLLSSFRYPWKGCIRLQTLNGSQKLFQIYSEGWGEDKLN